MDSVSQYDDKTVNVYMKIYEGEKYYLRDITWVGNTVYPSDLLSEQLRMKKGDVYNQKLLNERISGDEDAIGNNYYNRGYVFYNLDPVEVNIDGDSIDLEMRITEGPQATISHVRINGNDRLYENIVRRELRTRPGDKLHRWDTSTQKTFSQTYSLIHRTVQLISTGDWNQRPTTRWNSLQVGDRQVLSVN